MTFAGNALTLLAWCLLAWFASVLAGTGLTERRASLMWGSLGICVLIASRAIVWWFS